MTPDVTESAPGSSRRTLYILLGALGALLIAVIVVGVVLINTLTTQAENERYQDCMAAHGFPADETPEGVTDDASLDAYIDAAVEAAEFCSR